MIRIPAGVRVLVGAPSRPFDQSTIGAIKEAIECVEAVQEGHLPQILIEGIMSTPAKVVVIVVAVQELVDSSAMAFARELAGKIEGGRAIDLLPLVASDPLLGLVRKSSTEIFRR